MYQNNILNLYGDKNKSLKEKLILELFLQKIFGSIFLEVKETLKLELYIQLLSVLNPLFKEGNYLLLKKLFLKSYYIRNKLLIIQDYISPSLIFFPMINNDIFFKKSFMM